MIDIKYIIVIIIPCKGDIMKRKVTHDNEDNTEIITTEEFDDVICHSEVERKYFTIDNNNMIYKRFREELKIDDLPYLGPCVDFGLGDVCLEESQDKFKFYIIDRATKFNLEEFDNIEDAIDKLVSYYKEYDLVDDPDKMKEIIYEALGLSQIENITMKLKYIKIK